MITQGLSESSESVDSSIQIRSTVGRAGTSRSQNAERTCIQAEKRPAQCHHKSVEHCTAGILDWGFFLCRGNDTIATIHTPPTHADQSLRADTTRIRERWSCFRRPRGSQLQLNKCQGSQGPPKTHHQGFTWLVRRFRHSQHAVYLFQRQGVLQFPPTSARTHHDTGSGI